MLNRSHLGVKSLVFFLVATVTACEGDYTPKPRGYFRIQFPEKGYKQYKSACNFSFNYPTYALIEPDTSAQAKPCWMDVAFPAFNARLHLSYYPVRSNEVFNELTEDARTFAFKHTVKATAIDEALISYPDKKVHGVFYTIEGNTASAMQFFLTDSSENYLRGALYFNEKPRLDSIQPVLKFLKDDLHVMIESTEWK
ncbi:gliding motility lipoprotein GldD [Olivibacter sp. SDN3]|uniref:gliding motility lipoprotein GldD n=1 Tax=Olivibacter sp. SDN3 TaxID=2764720 RepID=UPI001650E552|nr:gliding motility lipoprotein GldD [Olivibacter sp. SDN3]QNL51153.1 gliding motility lipoprotein GldD [Olivibacter sp. SDN3]